MSTLHYPADPALTTMWTTGRIIFIFDIMKTMWLIEQTYLLDNLQQAAETAGRIPATYRSLPSAYRYDLEMVRAKETLRLFLGQRCSLTINWWMISNVLRHSCRHSTPSHECTIKLFLAPLISISMAIINIIN